MDWQKMDTEPNDGNFRLYGLHVKNRAGYRWFEVHYIRVDDDGTLIEPSGDNFSTWEYDDFEVWANVPQPPAAHMKGRTYYSDKIKGARGNYDWPVTYDLTDGYLGITQTEGDAVKDRVLLSPMQVKELTEFIERHQRRRAA